MKAEVRMQSAEVRTADPAVIAKERSDCGNLTLEPWNPRTLEPFP